MPDFSEHRTTHETLLTHAQASGWKFVPASDARARRRREGGAFFYQTLEDKLVALNPGVVTADNVGVIVRAMEAVQPTIEGNADLLAWLRGEKSIAHPAKPWNVRVTLIDFVRTDRNAFECTGAWSRNDGPETSSGSGVMFLINGVPVALADSNAVATRSAVEKVLAKLARHHTATPEMLLAPAVFSITDLIEHFGSATWNLDATTVFDWKSEAGAGTRTNTATRLRRFFEPTRFLTALRLWIVSYRKNDELRKSVLRRHQLRAVERVVARASDAVSRTGIAWHAQGSGKTFTLITAAQVILELKEQFSRTTVVLVLDRNEFEGQLAGWVASVLGELRSREIRIERAQIKSHLRELLAANFRGLIVTTVHAFDAADRNFCARPDVVVLFDEIHRSVRGNLLTKLLAAFPKAKIIGFAGTPIDTTPRGRNTTKLSGTSDERDYLDSYSITQSIADGTTLKLRQQFVPDELTAPAGLLKKEFLARAQAKGVSEVEELDHLLARAVNLKVFLKSGDHIAKVAAFVAQHFRENVQPPGYKAFLVAVDREACALYKQALDRLLPPEWIVPIYAKDTEALASATLATQYALDEKAEASARRSFSKPGWNPQLLIATDKLLSGYDVPALYCLYLDKPMRDHVLLQTMARVNRPFAGAHQKPKPCGLIVDFVGILKEPKNVLAFDPEDIRGLIEGVEVLQARFAELLCGPARNYLPARTGYETPDPSKALLLNEAFADEKNRTAFLEVFDEMEELYDILSPAPWLREHIEPYGRLAALREVVLKTYPPPMRPRGKPSQKTQRLVRENAAAYGLAPAEVPWVLDETTLAEILQTAGTDEAKVRHLTQSLARESSQNGTQQPFLVSLAAQAGRVAGDMEARRVAPTEARQAVEKLATETIALKWAREALEISADAFGVFWHLQETNVVEPESLAGEIDAVVARFPNHDANAAEFRQLNGELLGLLLRRVDGTRLIELADQLLAPARARSARRSVSQLRL